MSMQGMSNGAEQWCPVKGGGHISEDWCPLVEVTLYSGISDSGRSEIRTLSLQRTQLEV